MNRLFYAFFVILSSVWTTYPVLGWADDFYLEMADGSSYDVNYAQDFNRCLEHFWQGNVPMMADDLVDDNYPLCFHGFAVLYSGVSKTALYAAEHLTKDRVVQADTLVRTDNFRLEPRLPIDKQATLADYQGAGYDRGHLAPNGDMADTISQYDSFSLANIVPQDSTHNRALWRDIESHVRSLATTYGDVYVVTGVGFATPELETAGKLLVPTHLYKAVYIPSLDKVGVYYTKNGTGGKIELIDVETLTARTGVMPFVLSSKQTMNDTDTAAKIFALPISENAAKKVSLSEFLKLTLQKLWQRLG